MFEGDPPRPADTRAVTWIARGGLLRGKRLLMFGLAVACLSWPVPARAVPLRANSADDFVESIGVNTHLGFTDTVYRDQDRVKDKLVKLGVRYLRDGVSQGQPWVYDTYRQLAARGIKANILVADPLVPQNGSIDDQLALIKRELLPAVASLEGPNEYNCRDKSPDWTTTLRNFQARLYEQAKADTSLSRFPVLGPTLCGREGYQALGDISGRLDYGNIHTYPGGAMPDQDWHLQMHLDWAASVSGPKAVQATETGYHNAVNIEATFGHRPASERAAGIYMPRLYLSYFRAGYARAFAYELIDLWPNPARDNNEKNFGLLRNDFTEKPAFDAVSNLIALLSDRGPAFTPGSLDYAVDGAPTSLRQVLLQKRDGSFYLALWNQVSVWDPNPGKDLYPAEQEVTLRLAQPVAHATAYRPGESTTSYESWRNISALRLRVRPDVTIVRLGGSPESPSGSPSAGCACEPNARRPGSQVPGTRRFELDLGRARRGSRISIRWPAGSGRRYRVGTSAAQRKFRRAGVVRLRKNGRGVVRFRPRRVRCVRLVQIDRRPPAVGSISRKHVRLGGRRR